MPLTALTCAAEVLLATDHDPYVRGSLRRPDVTGWAGHGAVAWRSNEERTAYLMTRGEPSAVALLVEELLPELRDRTRVTLPRGTARLLPAWVAMADATDWDLRWTDTPPPVQPGEDRVVEVTAEEVAAVLPAWSPRASAPPGDAAVRSWLGIRGGGGLLACAADTSAANGVGHLSSIAVDPSSRSQGLGAATTAALIRRLFGQGVDLVTLGMYADNAAGRALYDRLGMHDHHWFTSGPLQVRSRW